MAKIEQGEQASRVGMEGEAMSVFICVCVAMVHELNTEPERARDGARNGGAERKNESHCKKK